MNKQNYIEHQFLNEKFFIPTWKIKTLVLGTFNPSCGEKTDYFYGRYQNNFWRTIENIYNLENAWFQDNLVRKLNFMKQNEIGCTDIIKSLTFSDKVEREDICGTGYRDQILFTKYKCTLTYNFEDIKKFIKKSNVNKIIHTWGKRDKLNEFKNQLNDLKLFCSQNGISFINDCPSPSGRFKSQTHKEKLIDFYRKHL